MIRHRLIALLPALCLLAAACSTGRITTTSRTAVEQALLSQSVEDTLAQMKLESIAGKTFVVKKDFCNATDSEFLLGALNCRLLELGGFADDDKSSKSQAVVYPVVAHSAVDDASFLIGIPDFPIAVPGFGSVTIPEMALYKHSAQTGRNRMMVYAKERQSGRLMFCTGEISSQKNYERWVVLFLLHFRTTDLKTPH